MYLKRQASHDRFWVRYKSTCTRDLFITGAALSDGPNERPKTFQFASDDRWKLQWAIGDAAPDRLRSIDDLVYSLWGLFGAARGRVP